MNISHTYYRGFQMAFGLGARLLPWRQPICVEGLGALGRIPALLRTAEAKKPLIVASRRQCATPAFLSMAQALPSYAVYHDVTPNPTVTVAEEIAALYRAEKCDSFVAIGGGSPMDAAKAAAALLVRPGKRIADLGGLLRVRRSLMPFIAVPTTAGTGSEATIAAVITDEHHHKYAVSDLCLVPRYAVLDPALTVSLPPHITAETGMDALTHAVEAYMSRYYNTAETRRWAEEAVVDIFRYLPAAYRSGEDVDARQKLLTASYKAGLAFTRASVGNVHALAHPLSGLYGTSHGLANAVLLPFVLREYGEAAAPRLSRLGELIGLTGRDDWELAQAFITAVFALNDTLGIPRTLPEVREQDLPQMASWAAAEANPTYPVPVIWDEADFMALYRRIMPKV